MLNAIETAAAITNARIELSFWQDVAALRKARAYLAADSAAARHYAKTNNPAGLMVARGLERRQVEIIGNLETLINGVKEEGGIVLDDGTLLAIDTTGVVL